MPYHAVHEYDTKNSVVSVFSVVKSFTYATVKRIRLRPKTYE